MTQSNEARRLIGRSACRPRHGRALRCSAPLAEQRVATLAVMRRAKEPLSEQISHAEQRLHVLDALARAIADPHRVLDLILNAPDVEAAETELRQAFGFDAVQASVVTNMQFRHASTYYRRAIERERDEIAAEVARLRQEI